MERRRKKEKIIKFQENIIEAQKIIEALGKWTEKIDDLNREQFKIDIKHLHEIIDVIERLEKEHRHFENEHHDIINDEIS